MKLKIYLILGLLGSTVFANCEERKKRDEIVNGKRDSVKNEKLYNSKNLKNEMKDIDTSFSIIGNWYATNFFFYSKVGTIGIDESKKVISKCLYSIENFKLVSHIKETGYNLSGETIFYDTIRISNVIKADLLKEYSNSFRYFEVTEFNKNIKSNKIKLIELGRKKDLDSDNKDIGWYATLIVDNKNVWIDNGGGAFFKIEKK